MPPAAMDTIGFPVFFSIVSAIVVIFLVIIASIGFFLFKYQMIKHRSINYIVIIYISVFVLLFYLIDANSKQPDDSLQMPVVLMSCFVTVFGFIYGFNCFRWARKVEDIPTARIQSAPQAYVEIIGKAKSLRGSPMHAPGANVPCVWYRAKVSERSEHSGEAHLIDYKSKESFLIDDGTGVCRIDTLLADIIPSNRWSFSKDIYKHLRREDGSTTVMCEWIGEGETVHALGWFDTKYADRDKLVNDRVKARLTAIKHYDKALEQYDTDGDGAVSQQEWENATDMIEDEARAKVDEQFANDASLSGAFHVLKRATQGSLPLTVSGFDERPLVKKYRINAIFWWLMGLSHSFIGALIFANI